MSSSETTTDHDVIRKWVEARKGVPAVVAATEGKDHDGILRIEFDKDQDSLDEVPWDDFFRTFERNKLAFLYQDKTKDGATSRFFKFVRREG